MKLLPWALVFALVLFSLYTLAISRGENVNAMWLVTAAIGTYAIGYRFYSRFIAERVLGLDARRRTPALRRNDGLDYVPTDKWVLFGHHFAAIAGAGPLVGPVLAAQMGYLPGTLWLLTGVVFAGAVQDFLVLFISTRRDGRSLGDMISTEMGRVPGVIAMIGVLLIMIILLAVLALVVVKALADSPWGDVHRYVTMPIAVFMGVYGRYHSARPHRRNVGDRLRVCCCWHRLRPHRRRRSRCSAPILHLQGREARLHAHRLWLRGFGAAGVDAARAARLSLDLPEDRHDLSARDRHFHRLARPPDAGDHQFVDGTGPVFAGNLFPFLFITIACGAVSGFHSLVSSGTTPKMIDNETARPFHRLWRDADGELRRDHGADRRLSVLEPGLYFAMNSAPALIGATPEIRGGRDLGLGLCRHAGNAVRRRRGTSAKRRSCRAPAARRRSPSAWRIFSRPPSAARA